TFAAAASRTTARPPGPSPCRRSRRETTILAFRRGGSGTYLKPARASLAVVAAIASFALATSSFAAATAADRETARALVQEGKLRKEKNDLPGALQSFKGADAIMHVPTTGMLVARTQVDMGLLVDA